MSDEGEPSTEEPEPSDWVEAGSGAKQATGALYRAIWDRPDWQRGPLGLIFFLVTIYYSQQIQTVIEAVISILPVQPNFVPSGSFFTSNLMIVILLAAMIAYLVRKLNRIEQKTGTMLETRADGGSPRGPRGGSGGLDPADSGSGKDDSPGGGAIGGAIAGAALGSAYGPGGTIGGFVLGAILGDSIAKKADQKDNNGPGPDMGDLDRNRGPR